ncbi:MAG: histidinol-phosphatase HisJ family protein [Ruminococcaceae bacterium]|nr:histidinol-phosphatase HisJ family protein [Oscillospiraceae bacterium]
MKLQAHRGVSTEYPENTFPAVFGAIEQGYDVIELDVGVTKDNVFVLLHDDTLNRTVRYADGSQIAEKTELSDVTYEELLGYDFGVWFAPKFKGTPVCLLVEALSAARNAGVKVKIDNKYRRFTKEQKDIFFTMLREWQDVAELTAFDTDMVKEAAEAFKDMDIHYDGLVSKEILDEITQIISPERLTVWLPYQNKHTQWVKVDFANKENVRLIKDRGAKVGVWILSEYDELEKAKMLGADIIETHGQIKPVKNKGVFADMHTHSRNSHDAKFPVMDICKAEIEAGVKIMAVTDHCDSFLCRDNAGFDMYSNIVASYKEALAANEEAGDKCEVLTGIELGEGFWYPAYTKKVLGLMPYDVVIGSVHAVMCPLVEGKTGTKIAFSQIAWENVSEEEIADFFDRYFDDVLTCVQTQDIDIMAHLGCTKGYIVRKKALNVDLHPYEDKIRKIFEVIIKRGIAMEVSTSPYADTGLYYPDEWIIKMYREMGGYLVTMSSDAHSPKKAGNRFAETAEMLREMGFKNIFYYKNRRSYQCTL